MRALLVFPEFPLSYWAIPIATRISRRKAAFPPLGLMTVAALLPADWECRLADLNVGPITEDDWAWAEIVLVSAMLPQRPGLRRVIREARSRGKTTAAGGPYPTSNSDEVIEAGCDWVVCGEGERTIPLWLEELQAGRRGPRVIEAEGHPDMTSSPVPRFDLLRPGDYLNFAIQASRGCIHDCEFCDVVKLLGRKMRYKAPRQVVAELEALRKVTGRGWSVFFADDNLIGHRGQARALLEAVREWNLANDEPFGYTAQATLDLGCDLEMIDLLTSCNFGEVFIGVESPEAEALTLASKSHNLRQSATESLLSICRNGLTVTASFIIGMDGETAGTGDRICRLAEDANLPMPMLNLLIALRGTRLWKRLEKEGRLRPEMEPELAPFGPQNLRPLRPEAEVLREYVKAWDDLFEPSRYFARLARFYTTMRPTRAAQAAARGEKPAGKATRSVLKRNRLDVLRIGARALWEVGIKPSSRLHFWRAFRAVRRNNPSRLWPFMDRSVMWLDMMNIRRILLRNPPAPYAGPGA